jgi:hypothetical protein
LPDGKVAQGICCFERDCRPLGRGCAGRAALCDGEAMQVHSGAGAGVVWCWRSSLPCSDVRKILLKTTFKALPRVSLCPWRIGAITAAALVLDLEHRSGSLRALHPGTGATAAATTPYLDVDLPPSASSARRDARSALDRWVLRQHRGHGPVRPLWCSGSPEGVGRCRRIWRCGDPRGRSWWR